MGVLFRPPRVGGGVYAPFMRRLAFGTVGSRSGKTRLPNHNCWASRGAWGWWSVTGCQHPVLSDLATGEDPEARSGAIRGVARASTPRSTALAWARSRCRKARCIKSPSKEGRSRPAHTRYSARLDAAANYMTPRPESTHHRDDEAHMPVHKGDGALQAATLRRLRGMKLKSLGLLDLASSYLAAALHVAGAQGAGSGGVRHETGADFPVAGFGPPPFWRWSDGVGMSGPGSARGPRSACGAGVAAPVLAVLRPWCEAPDVSRTVGS